MFRNIDEANLEIVSISPNHWTIRYQDEFVGRVTKRAENEFACSVNVGKNGAQTLQNFGMASMLHEAALAIVEQWLRVNSSN